MNSKAADSSVYSIVFVLDKSGSMEIMGIEPVQSMNNFIKTQKDNNLKFKFTLVLFNDKVEFLLKNVDSEEITEIKTSDYVPNGMTSLYDAIGQSISYQEEQNNDNVIFVILTDGHENSSSKYDQPKIKKMISDKESINKWKFNFLAANQDSFTVGPNLGIPKACCSDFVYNACGLNNIMREISGTISATLSSDHEKHNKIE